MNTIELMLEALKAVYLTCDWHGDDGKDAMQLASKAITAGEAELKREPVAWMDKHGNIERGWDAILNPNEFTPLYTRGEA